MRLVWLLSTGLVKPLHHVGHRREGCLCVQFILTNESAPLLFVLGVCRYQCFKSAWMFEVFHRGFSFPVNYKNLKTALQVYDKEVQWTLGAILYRTRFLPLRYGREFGQRDSNERSFSAVMMRHGSHGVRMSGVLLLALAVRRLRSQWSSTSLFPPQSRLPSHPSHPVTCCTKGLMIFNCLLPKPCTEGFIPGFLTFTALDPFSKCCF